MKTLFSLRPLPSLSPRRSHARFPRCLALAVLAALALLAPPLSAWSASGHRIIAAAAAQFLTPAAKAATTELLGRKTLTSAAIWADSVRPYRPETVPYHFIDLPLASDRFDPTRDDPGGHSILSATERFLTTLADASLATPTRAEALQFVLHLVADLHQPLHCGSNHDAGGNNTMVTLGRRKMNLHRLWDLEFFTFAGLNDKQYAEVLADQAKKLTPAERAAMEQGSITDWALEAHRIARDAYDLPPDRRLDDAYLTRHQPAVERQLVRAIVRLALVLNRCFDPSTPSGEPSGEPLRQPEPGNSQPADTPAASPAPIVPR